ncbi:MAG: PIG-L deacetylase family protein [Mycobacteriales bacterium]
MSPHLDDAVLSVGATLASAARRGVDVTVVTVFAYDLSADAPAGAWDRSSGFRTVAEAGRARREEDRLACAAIGATPIWLPFQDHEYAPTRQPAEVRDSLIDVLSEHDVALIPGWPLMNPDHRWVVGHLANRLPTSQVSFYREQPYACDRLYRAILRRPAGRDPRPAIPKASAATSPDLSVGAWRAKLRAVSQYRSQLQQLGPFLRPRLLFYEVVAGGEALALQGAPTWVGHSLAR